MSLCQCWIKPHSRPFLGGITRRRGAKLIDLASVQPPPYKPLEEQVRQLQVENQELREHLARIEKRAAQGKEARARLLRGGFRILVPLLDRQRVARSFAKLAQTTAGLTGPRMDWPTRDEILADAREFLESCVRFVIRRRLFMLFISLLAAAIPAIQIYLVFQQNEIIENQNKFFEIQVYDVVSRSMTEGDRNARLMTGALLANADLDFLRGVVEEAFDPALASVYRAEGVNATERRFEDSAFRGHLLRAVSRSVEVRAAEPGAETDELFAQARPMLRRAVRDAAERIPQLLRLSRGDVAVDGALAEQVDNYFSQVGGVLRVYGRLARSAEEQTAFYDDIRPLFQRLTTRRDAMESRFAHVYQAVLQDFLFEMATEPKLGDPPVNLEQAGLTPEQALTRGLGNLRRTLGDERMQWDLFEQQMVGQ